MAEVKLGMHTVDLPFTLRLYGVTEEKFDQLTDEDTKAELLDGVMIVHSPASLKHNRIAGFMRRLMGDFAEEKALGEVFGPDDLVHLATCRKFAPDGVFLEEDRVPDSAREKEIEGAPDWIMEVLSPSNRDYDLEEKRPAYRKAGVKEIWIIDPEVQVVIVDRRGKKGYRTTTVSEGRLTSTVVPGFWIDVAWLWEEPLPKAVACLREILE